MSPRARFGPRMSRRARFRARRLREDSGETYGKSAPVPLDRARLRPRMLPRARFGPRMWQDSGPESPTGTLREDFYGKTTGRQQKDDGKTYGKTSPGCRVGRDSGPECCAGQDSGPECRVGQGSGPECRTGRLREDDGTAGKLREDHGKTGGRL